MSTEENVHSSNVDVEAYRRAAHKYSKKILRRRRAKATAKTIAITILLVVIAVAVYLMTQLLLVNHTTDTRQPWLLIIIMAIFGAILAVGTIVAVIYLIVIIAQSLHESVGFDGYFVMRGVWLVSGVFFVCAAITSLYLALFFSI